MADITAKFKPNEDLKLKMEENFGRKEAKDLPLYAYGNKLSFYRLPTYPEENENRPQGITFITNITIFTILNMTIIITNLSSVQPTAFSSVTRTTRPRRTGWVPGSGRPR